MMKNFAFYDNYIQTHFIKEDCGIDLNKIGEKYKKFIYLLFPLDSHISILKLEIA